MKKRCCTCLEHVDYGIHVRNINVRISGVGKPVNEPTNSAAHYSLAPSASYSCFVGPDYVILSYTTDQ